jgi:hypothetical protein
VSPFHVQCRYGDKLLALDDGSGRCAEFVGAAVDLVAELAALVKTVSGLADSRAAVCCNRSRQYRTTASFKLILFVESQPRFGLESEG